MCFNVRTLVYLFCKHVRVMHLLGECLLAVYNSKTFERSGDILSIWDGGQERRIGFRSEPLLLALRNHCPYFLSYHPCPRRATVLRFLPQIYGHIPLEHNNEFKNLSYLV